jgi:hypothetical protein
MKPGLGVELDMINVDKAHLQQGLGARDDDYGDAISDPQLEIRSEAAVSCALAATAASAKLAAHTTVAAARIASAPPQPSSHERLRVSHSMVRSSGELPAEQNGECAAVIGTDPVESWQQVFMLWCRRGVVGVRRLPEWAFRKRRPSEPPVRMWRVPTHATGRF